MRVALSLVLVAGCTPFQLEPVCVAHGEMIECSIRATHNCIVEMRAGERSLGWKAATMGKSEDARAEFGVSREQVPPAVEELHFVAVRSGKSKTASVPVPIKLRFESKTADGPDGTLLITMNLSTGTSGTLGGKPIVPGPNVVRIEDVMLDLPEAYRQSGLGRPERVELSLRNGGESYDGVTWVRFRYEAIKKAEQELFAADGARPWAAELRPGKARPAMLLKGDEAFPRNGLRRLRDLEIVVHAEGKLRQIEYCGNYGSWSKGFGSIHRRRWNVRLRAVEARTGTLLGEVQIEGAEPRRCEKREEMLTAGSIPLGKDIDGDYPKAEVEAFVAAAGRD